MSKPKIVFMGTPEFARVHLQALYDAGYPVLAVFSQPDKPSGRGQKMGSPPCAVFAKEKNIPLYQPDSLKNDEITKSLKKLAPDFIVVVAYGLFLPQSVIEIPKIDTLNIHASLLPKYRGAAPIQWAVIKGETETGVSLMRLVKKMDAGPVYAVEKIPIHPEDSAGSLFKKLAPLGARLLVEKLPLIQMGQIGPVGQDENNVCFAPQLKKDDGLIDWQRDAHEIDRQVHGCNPWPGAYTFIAGKRLKICDCTALSENVSMSPGTVYLLSPRGIHVVCGQQSLLVKEVQLEGKSKMFAADFARGLRLREGMKFD